MPVVAEPPAPAAKPGELNPAIASNISKMGDAFRQRSEPTTAPAAPVVPDPVIPPASSAIKEDPKATKKELNFKALNDEFDKFRATAQTKQQEAEKTLNETRAAHQKELEETKGKLSQYEKIVQRLALEHDPKFKEAFDRKIDLSVASIKEAVGSTNAEKIEKILRQPPSEARDEMVEELTEGLSEFKRGRLVDAYNKLSEVQRLRDAELANASQNVELLDKYRQQEAAQNDQQKRQFSDNVFQAELAKFSQVIPDFKEIDGDKEHNELVSKTRQEAKDWLSADLNDGDRARMALWAAKGRNSIQTDALKDALIAKLKQQVSELTAADPSLRGNGEGKTRPKPITSTDVASRYQRAMKEGVPQRQAA